MQIHTGSGLPPSIKFYLSFFLVLVSLYVSAQPIKVANYKIDAVLNPDTKIIQGKQTLLWTNTSHYAIKELHFHMYLNAFKDEHSTFMKESGGGRLRNDRADISKLKNRGSIQLTKIIYKDFDLSGNTKYIQPDNFNQKDHTVLKIDLPTSVQPGEQIELQISFESKLPKIFARTGWAAHNYFFVGQWFPKIGVLESNGKWNCHQFHANTEFFSDFGDYHVNLIVPSSFIVAGTGVKTSEVNLKNMQKQVSFFAENVHDFAWTASPNYVEINDKYKGISLNVFMQKEQVGKSNRYLSAVKNAIDYMEVHVGRYPHPVLNIIDPSLDGSGSGGMEYPMLITCGATYGTGKWYRYQEVVTIHEFVHQYFQGLIASNEFEDSWMDEGFTQYMEGRIMDAYYPKGSMFDFFGLSVNDLAMSRISYVTIDNPRLAVMRTDAWKYPGGTYEIMSYTKPAVVLKTLENLLGTEVMDEILQTYFNRFKFRHPNPTDFFGVASEVAAKRNKFKSLDWYFEQTILQSKVCDYAVTNLKNEGNYSRFTLKNLNDMKLPVEVLVRFTDGTSKTLVWNGSTKNLKLKGQISFVQIDPNFKNLLDINLINNSISADPPYAFFTKYTAKLLFWIQNILVFI